MSIPLHEIDVSKNKNATPEFLAINPMGKLPVSDLDDGSILTESIATCRHTIFGLAPSERRTRSVHKST